MIEPHWSQDDFGQNKEAAALSDPSWYVYLWLTTVPRIVSHVLTDGQARMMPTVAGEIRQQLEATNPLAGQQTVYVDLLNWAIQQVDCVAVASALYGEEGEGYL